MIKNIYEPDNEDVLFWLAHNEKWPDPDWDLYVVNGKNDDLVFQLANDNACPEQENSSCIVCITLWVRCIAQMIWRSIGSV